MLKIVCGTFNQGAIELFGSNAGKQCTCNAITSLAWASIRRVGNWKSSDLDRILRLGNSLYTSLITERRETSSDGYLALDDLPCNINLHGYRIVLNTILTSHRLAN